MKQDLKSKYPDKHLVSYSQMKTFVQCPHKWENKYVKKLRPATDSIHNIGGTAFHEVIQDYLEELYNGDPDKAENMDLKKRFMHRLKEEHDKVKETEKWQEKDEDPATKEELKEYVKKTFPIIDEFKKYRSSYFDPEFQELVGIEVPIEEEVKNGVVFIGFLDVVLKEKYREKYTIVDIKTSTKGWDRWKKQEPDRVNQLLTYRDFYSRQLNTDPENIEIKYWITAREIDGKWKTNHIEEWNPPTDQENEELITDWINEFLSDGFPNGNKTDEKMTKNPEKFKCSFCPYSKQFNPDSKYGICDQDGETFDDYPQGMKGYIDDKWIK